MVDSVLNKLTGVLLRSGRSGDYSSLGEAGQPVFRVAGPLREALRRKLGFIDGVSGATYADHFAVPKTDQLGDIIDWYSNCSGDVIPWSSATEDERDLARYKLRTLEQKVNQYCEGFNQLLEERNGSARSAPVSLDAQVFNKLLSKVLHTPDANHIYLVNGFPVLTFWGFVYPKASVPTDPLLHLFNAPQANTPVPLASEIEAPLITSLPEPVIVTDVTKRSWWRRWLWLLPLLLLLLLLLFGLRYCSPQMANSLGLPDLSLNKPNISFPGFPKLPDIASEGFTLPGASGAAGDTNGLGQGAQPDMPEPSANNTPETDSGSELPETDLPDPALPTDPPELPGDTPSVEPPQLPPDQVAPEGSGASPRGQDLQIPPSIPDGQADFLNGKWKAGAGIQDKNTGKPLRLEYEFNKGKGQVTVQSADGMRCSGDVNAEMVSGSMRINSLGAARCADGSSFDMPEITCAPGAKTAADCTGGYADTRFPMSMRNTQ